jgi:hypothetical protein
VSDAKETYGKGILDTIQKSRSSIRKVIRDDDQPRLPAMQDDTCVAPESDEDTSKLQRMNTGKTQNSVVGVSKKNRGAKIQQDTPLKPKGG